MPSNLERRREFQIGPETNRLSDMLHQDSKWMNKNRFKKEKNCKTWAGSYIWEAHGAVPLHYFLDLAQAAVVPARKLEPQRPVGGDDGPADKLLNTNGHYFHLITF